MTKPIAFPFVVLTAALVFAACGGPGGNDGGSGGGSGGAGGGGASNCSNTNPNSWSLGSQCWTAGEVKCEARSGKSVMEAVAVSGTSTGAFTLWFQAPVTAAASFALIPFTSADGGNQIPDAGEAQLSLAANVGSGSIEGLLSTSGTVTTTVSGGKATASYAGVTIYARDGGVVGQATGSVTCP